MKKKVFLMLLLTAVMLCVLSISVFAEDIIVSKIESAEYGTVIQLNADPGLDNAKQYLSTLNKINDAGTDKDALCILTDGNADNPSYYVFPSSYIVDEREDGVFDIVATDLAAAMAEFNTANGTSYYAEITIEGKTEKILVPMSKWSYSEAEQSYYVTVELAAKNMVDLITVELYKGEIGSDSAYKVSSETEAYQDSVEFYAWYVVNYYEEGFTEELRSMMVNMLNYGAAAQNLFTYRTDELATRYITAEQQATYADTVDATMKDDTIYDSYFYDNTLNLESSITFNFYFDILEKDSENITITTSYVDFYGNVKETKIANDELVFGDVQGRGIKLIVEVDGMKATDMNRVITVTVKDGENVLSTVICSMEDYFAYATDVDDILDEVAVAMMKYGNSAEAYFGK